MIYVKSDSLRTGMRLAKPIYNKKGVLLYDRNDKITKQGIESVKNFGLIGLYILEPAEPLPPMSEEEIEFERFQTMAVFTLREDLDTIMQGEAPTNLMQQTNEIVSRFGNLYHKINFNQNLRSTEDYVYKHALNVAILSALIAHRAGLDVVKQTEVVVAALLHDVGKLSLKSELRGKMENLSEEEMALVAKTAIIGVDKISNAFQIPAGVKSTLTQFCQLQYLPEKTPAAISESVRILVVANAYDEWTSMQLDVAPHTEVEAVRMLLDRPDLYDSEMVNHLLNSIKILYPGVCVELTNMEKGLVLRENDEDILRPVVLGFEHNQVYDMDVDSVYSKIQIKNIMKTMDNRIKVDPERLKEYM